MSETIILSSDGSIEKSPFVSMDLAQSYVLDFIKTKESKGHKAFAVIDEGGVLSYLAINQNALVSLRAQEFFSALGELRAYVSDKKDETKPSRWA